MSARINLPLFDSYASNENQSLRGHVISMLTDTMQSDHDNKKNAKER